MIKSASLKKRIFGALIDYGLYFLFYLLYVFYFGEKTFEGFEVSGFKALPLFFVWIVYFPFAEFLFSQTLGKYLMSISIVKVNDQNLTFLDSLKRRIIDPLDFFFFGIVGIIAQKIPLCINALVIFGQKHE